MEIVAPPHLPEVSPPDQGPRPPAGHEMAVGRDTRRQLHLEGAAQGPAIRTRFAPLDGQARVLGEEVPIGAANCYRRLVCHLAPGPDPRWAPRRRRVPRRPAGPLSSAPGALEVLEQVVRDQAEQVPRIPMSSSTKTIREKDGGRRAEQLKCDAGALAYRTSHVIHGIGRRRGRARLGPPPERPGSPPVGGPVGLCRPRFTIAGRRLDVGCRRRGRGGAFCPTAPASPRRSPRRGCPGGCSGGAW
jgi:hypothetical protein